MLKRRRGRDWRKKPSKRGLQRKRKLDDWPRRLKSNGWRKKLNNRGSPKKRRRKG